MSGPRILFMGTPDFAVGSLEALLESGYNVVCVVTVPDRPAGRGRKLRGSAVKEFAVSKGLPLLQPERLRDAYFLAQLSALRPDIGVVVAFRKLPKDVYALPRLGFFNLHASLLPDYRGAAPINWALINGESESGVTTFLLNDRIDEGEILLRESVLIGVNDTAGDLHDHLRTVGARLVVETVQGLHGGGLTPRVQPAAAHAPLAPKIFRADCRLDFSQSAQQVHNLCRGISPYPGAWCEMRIGDGEYQEVKLFSSMLMGGLSKIPVEVGESCVAADRLAIACGDKEWIYIAEIQPAGRRRMPVADFLRGIGSEVLCFR